MITRFTWTLFLTSKDEAFEYFLVLLKKIERRVEHSLVSLRSEHDRNLKTQALLTIVINMVLIIIFLPLEHLDTTGWWSAKIEL